VEVPPRNAVLGGDDGGVGTQERFDERTGRRVGVGLEPQDDMVDGPDRGRVVGGVRMSDEIAAWTDDLHALLTERGEMWAARDEVDLDVGATQRGSHVSADGACTEHSNLHMNLPRSSRPVDCIRYGEGS
jgi:hypothetical protein